MERSDQGETGVVGTGSAEDLAARLERAEERLAFYASFDRVIQENVSQAGRLMRDALELRERTRAELEEARAAAEARVAAERGRYRDDLAAVHAELVGLQATAAAMARRVAATLGELAASDAALGAGALGRGPGVTMVAVADTPAREVVEPGQSEAAVEAGAAGDGERRQERRDGAAVTDEVIAPPVADGAVVGEADEAAAVEGLTAAEGDEPVPGDAVAVEEASAIEGGEDEATSAVEEGTGALGVGSGDVAAAEAGPGEREVDGPGGEAAGFPVAGDSQVAGVATAVAGNDGVAVDAVAAPGVARAVTVLVHGVPRAAAALSLQRHLHGLRHVESVEAREYAEGVLRLQVMTGAALGMDDLRGWESGGGLEPVTVTADVIEVRLPGAHGF